MLVLSRRQGETVVIDTPTGQVKITVTEFRGGHVRLAFEAPPEVPIVRLELLPPHRQPKMEGQ